MPELATLRQVYIPGDMNIILKELTLPAILRCERFEKETGRESARPMIALRDSEPTLRSSLSQS